MGTEWINTGIKVDGEDPYGITRARKKLTCLVVDGRRLIPCREETSGNTGFYDEERGVFVRDEEILHQLCKMEGIEIHYENERVEPVSEEERHEWAAFFVELEKLRRMKPTEEIMRSMRRAKPGGKNEDK